MPRPHPTFIRVRGDQPPPDPAADPAGYHTFLLEQTLGRVVGLTEAIHQQSKELHDRMTDLQNTLDNLASAEEADIASIKSAVDAIQAKLTEATSAASPDLSKIQAAATDLATLSSALTPAASAPASASGGTTPAPSGSGASSEPTAPDAGTSEPASTAAPAPAVDPATSKVLYVHLGSEAIDAAAWPTASVVAGEGGTASGAPVATGTVLYTFSADTAGGAATGATAGVWEPYVGATTAASAAA